jgi:hypothetical protein
LDILTVHKNDSLAHPLIDMKIIIKLNMNDNNDDEIDNNRIDNYNNNTEVDNDIADNDIDIGAANDKVKVMIIMILTGHKIDNGMIIMIMLLTFTAWC